MEKGIKLNIYKNLNEIMQYIEEHLEEKIDCKEMSKIMGVNEYTFQRIFPVMCDISLSEYIRNRRLSNAGQDIFLGKEKIVDIAVRYQYNNATSFSRAFEKFHGIKPSKVKTHPEKLRMYPKMHFNENMYENKNIEYKIIQLEKLVLYGISKSTTNKEIKKDAPKFFKQNSIKYGDAPYCMTEYKDKERIYVKAYWVLYKEKHDGMKQIIIPKSKWICFRINSYKSDEIQKATDTFYKEFLPNCKYNFRNIPEIEYYHDNVTDLLIPIQD